MLKNFKERIRKFCDFYANKIIKNNSENLQNQVQELKFLINEQQKQFNAILSQINARLDSINSNTGNENYEKIMRILTAFNLHQKTFSPFKNINKGKNIVLVGAGPSLNDFVPIENAVYIGLNRAFKYDKVQFDYLFSIDFEGIKDYYKDFFSYNDGECVKFIGDQNLNKEKQIPESYIEGKNIYRYMTTAPIFNDRFAKNIDTELLGNFTTVSLQAIQFILFTNPKKIYLVGIDCTTSGHFIGKGFESASNENFEINTYWAIENWKKLKDFANFYYPEAEIISVNPVGLKGIFTDLYQNENGRLYENSNSIADKNE